MSEQNKITGLAKGVLAGDRRSLSRAITIAESTRADHRASAGDLIRALLPNTGNAIRVGISGVPGVGKSTFIEALGLHILDEGKKLAVLAVDPSSPKTGGSILGDKTRMSELSRHENAFIRGTPAAGSLGGVARYTRDVMLLVEAGGADVVIVETVGVGQSEFAVSNIVDFFVLLVAPGAGDDLQGIKKGIIELAELIIITKADGDLAPAAQRAQRDYSSALNLLTPSNVLLKPSVIKCSALAGEGIKESWEKIKSSVEVLNSSDQLILRRGERAKILMWEELKEKIIEGMKKNPKIKTVAYNLENKVKKGELGPAEAANILYLSLF